MRSGRVSKNPVITKASSFEELSKAAYEGNIAVSMQGSMHFWYEGNKIGLIHGDRGGETRYKKFLIEATDGIREMTPKNVLLTDSMGRVYVADKDDLDNEYKRYNLN